MIIDENNVNKYIENVLAKMKYPDPMPNIEKLTEDLNLCHLQERLERIKLIPDLDVFIVSKIKNNSGECSKNLCSLDLRLLKRIRSKKSLE